MSDLRSEFKSRAKVRWMATGLTVTIMIVVLAIALILLRDRETKVVQTVRFDSRACVRMADVSRVYRIKRQESRPGVLWFGTREGVRVLDQETVEWTRYGLEHGIPDETVSDIAFADDTVWIATWSGIAWLDSARMRFVPLPPQSAVAGARVLAIESMKDNGVYFSVDGAGVYHMPGTTSDPKRITTDGIASGARIACLRAIDSTLYIGAEGKQLLRLNRSGKSSLVPFARSDGPKTLIWDIMVRHDGLYVATSDDGIWRKAPGDDTLREVAEFPAKGAYVFAPEDDGFWCGTPFGLWRYHDDGRVWIQMVHPEERTPTDFQVFALVNAGEELWYGSMDLGAGFLKKKRIEWKSMRAGLSNPNVAALASDDSLLWTSYGYQGGYLDRFDAAKMQYDRNYNSMDGMVDGNIATMMIRDSVLYYGGYTSFGFVNFANGKRRSFNTDSGLPHGDIADIAEGGGDTLLLATLFGVAKYSRHSSSFGFIEKTGPFRVTALLVSGDSLWFGTLGRGLMVVNSRTGELSGPFLEFADRIVALVPFIAADSGEAIFVVTKTNGCFVLSSGSGQVSPVEISTSVLSGTAGDYPNHVMTSRGIDDKIWLGTRDAGCLVYDLQSRSWSRLSIYDGLISDQVRSLAASASYIWVGCYGGVNRYEKEYINKIIRDNTR